MDPFRARDRVAGVTYDGQHVWFASGDKLNAFDPTSGKARAHDRCCSSCRNGLRWPAPVPDRRGSHPEDRSDNRPSARNYSAAPGGGGDSGLTWAEGTLWVGGPGTANLHQIDPQTGAVLRTIESQPLRHRRHWWMRELPGTPPGKVTRANCGTSILKRAKGLASSRCRPTYTLRAPDSDGADRFFCGGGNTGKVRPCAGPERGASADKR